MSENGLGFALIESTCATLLVSSERQPGSQFSSISGLGTHSTGRYFVGCGARVILAIGNESETSKDKISELIRPGTEAGFRREGEQGGKLTRNTGFVQLQPSVPRPREDQN